MEGAWWCAGRTPPGTALGRPALANRATKWGAGLACGAARVWPGVERCKSLQERCKSLVKQKKSTQENPPWLRGVRVTGPCSPRCAGRRTAPQCLVFGDPRPARARSCSWGRLSAVSNFTHDLTAWVHARCPRNVRRRSPARGRCSPTVWPPRWLRPSCTPLGGQQGLHVQELRVQTWWCQHPPSASMLQQKPRTFSFYRPDQNSAGLPCAWLGSGSPAPQRCACCLREPALTLLSEGLELRGKKGGTRLVPPHGTDG